MSPRRFPLACMIFALSLAFAVLLSWRATWVGATSQSGQKAPKAPRRTARLAPAQTQPSPATIIRTLVFRQISRFSGGGPAIDKLKLSADGLKLIFAGNDKKVYTINADGTGFTQVFDYASLGPPRSPANVDIDISANGSKIIWTDGGGEIFIANFDGSNRQRIATAIPSASGGTEGLNTRIPRITADGARVYFSHYSGANSAFYRINADGSGLQPLFNYQDIVRLGNVSRPPDSIFGSGAGYDISDDGARLAFGTRIFGGEGQLITFDVTLRRVAEFSDESHLRLSRDGSKVIARRQIFGEPTNLVALNFSGGEQRTILANTGSGLPAQTNQNGAQVLYRGDDRYPFSLVNTDASGRLDLIIDVRCDVDPLARASVAVPSLSADGRRFAFKTEVAGQPQQLWIGDINPTSLGDAPRISEMTFNPNWVTDSTSSTFTMRAADAQGGQSGLRRRACGNTLRNGAYQFSYLVGGVPFGLALFDDGMNGGDSPGNDGVFTQNQVRRGLAPPDPNTALQIRMHAIAISQREITAVDATPFFVLAQPPTGSGPTITSITPSSGAAGSQVRITGSNFDPIAANNVVLFGNRQARVVSATADRTTLEVIVPPELPPGTVSVTVTVLAQRSNAVNFTVTGGSGSQFTVTTHLTTDAVSGACNPPPQAKTSFSPTDARVYQFTSGNGARIGDLVRWEFVQPNGTIHLTQNYTSTFAGDICFWAPMNIAGAPAASLLGNWQVRVFHNGTLIVTDNFTITQSGGCALIPISIGETKNGALTNTDCVSPIDDEGYRVDRYSFTAPAGQQVAIALTSTAFDTYLYLLNANGNILQENDDGGGGTNSRIPPGSGFITLQSAGTYLIEVSAYDPDSFGNYTLSLTAPNIQPTPTPTPTPTPAPTPTPTPTPTPGQCIAVSIPTSLTGSPNSALTVPINVSDTTGKNALSYDAVLAFNPSVLRLQNPPFDRTGTLSANLTVTTNSPTAGRLNISGFSSSPLTGSGVLLNLKFDVIGSLNSCSDLNWTSLRFNEGTPCSTTSNGRACATGGGSIAGAVSYCASSPSKPVPGVTITASGSPPASAATDNAGNYQLPNLGGGAYTLTPAKTGDANGITSFDAAQIAQHVVQIITLNACQQGAADTSGNGEITSFDAAFIAQYVVGITNPDNKTGTWKFLPPSRAYASLSGNQTAQNFDAVLMGELTGNWTPGAGNNLLAGDGLNKQHALSPTQVAISLPQMSAATGSSVTIPITVGDLTGRNFLSFDFDLTYDASVLQAQQPPTDATDTLSRNLTITANATPGRLRVSAFGAQAMAGAGTLLKLKFNVTGASGTGTALTWQRFIFNETPQTNLVNGRVNAANAVTSVSAASFLGESLAAESIVAGFGTAMAARVEVAGTLPLPTTLAGTTVRVRDSAGTERLAPLFFVAPAQINFQIPPGTATGPATITVTSGDRTVSSGSMTLAPVAPGLFSANASGQGVAAAAVLRLKANGEQVFEPVAVFDPARNQFAAAPIDLGPETDRVFLILFGTGWRSRSSLSATTVSIGGVNAEVLYAGEQGGFVGLDQLNARLSRSLTGRGEVDVVLMVDGKTANTTKVSFK